MSLNRVATKAVLTLVLVLTLTHVSVYRGTGIRFGLQCTDRE